jgi:hypothetical protein
MKKCLYFLKILKESGDSFITGKVLLQICITENCFQKHFRLTKVSTNRKPALRLWTFFLPWVRISLIKDQVHLVVILPIYFFEHC